MIKKIIDDLLKEELNLTRVPNTNKFVLPEKLNSPDVQINSSNATKPQYEDIKRELERQMMESKNAQSDKVSQLYESDQDSKEFRREVFRKYGEALRTPGFDKYKLRSLEDQVGAINYSNRIGANPSVKEKNEYKDYIMKELGRLNNLTSSDIDLEFNNDAKAKRRETIKNLYEELNDIALTGSKYKREDAQLQNKFVQDKELKNLEYASDKELKNLEYASDKELKQMELKAKSKEKKQISEKNTLFLGEVQAANDGYSELKTIVENNKNKFGFIKGGVMQSLPDLGFNTESKNLRSQLEKEAYTLWRSIDPKLSDQDAVRALRQIGDLNNTAEFTIKQLDYLKNKADKKYKAQIDAMDRSGYDVSGLKSVKEIVNDYNKTNDNKSDSLNKFTSEEEALKVMEGQPEGTKFYVNGEEYEVFY
jgi:hypothetical protein